MIKRLKIRVMIVNRFREIKISQQICCHLNAIWISRISLEVASIFGRTGHRVKRAQTSLQLKTWTTGSGWEGGRASLHLGCPQNTKTHASVSSTARRVSNFNAMNASVSNSSILFLKRPMNPQSIPQKAQLSDLPLYV